MYEIQESMMTETKNSIQCLFKFFCNNLKLGQWELASLCTRKVARLRLSDENSLNDVRAALTDVACYPYTQSYGSSPTISSCHHLSWLCFTENVKLHEHCGITYMNKDEISRAVEFRLLLMEIGSECDPGILRDLNSLHTLLWSTTDDIAHQEPYLTQDLLDFLCGLLKTRTSLGCDIIRSLTSSPDCYDNTKAILLHTYVKVIDEFIENIANADNENETVDPDNDSQNSHKSTEVYSLLAMLDVEVCDDFKLRLSATFVKLIEVCNTVGENRLSKDRILSALLAHSDTTFLDLFMSIATNIHSKTLVDESNLANCDSLVEEKRILLATIMGETGGMWRDVFLHCVAKRRHFLSDIVEICMECVRLRNFDLLSQLLAKPELRPLKRLVLLMAWKYCYTLTDAERLLSIGQDQEPTDRRGQLDEAVDKLGHQVNILQWCLHKTSANKKTSASLQHQLTGDLFNSLDTHSILSVLHECAKLSSLDETEVLDLLQSSSGYNNTGQPKKVVRFLDNSQSAEDKLSLQQRVDISLYHSYCAILRVMESIVFCETNRPSPPSTSIYHQKYASRSSQSSESSSSARKSSTSSTITDAHHENNTTHQQYAQDYENDVTIKLTQAKDHLAQVFPLNYRLEIVENIFSLLFVTHESYRDDAADSDSDSGALPDDTVSFTGSLGDLHSPVVDTPKSKTFADLSNSTYDEPFIDVDNRTSSKLSPDVMSDNTNTILSARRKSRTRSFTDGTKSSNYDSQGKSASTPSGSSSNMHKLGFISNEYVTRDIIHLVKTAIVDLGTERVKLQATTKSDSVKQGVEKSLMDMLPCSITHDVVQKRLNRLNHYVSEAHWRFQLVAHPSIPRDVGEVNLQVSASVDNDFDQHFATRRRSTHKRQKKCNSGGENEMATTESSQSNHTHSRPRSTSRNSSSSGQSISRVQHGIVAAMLSSHKSLLNLCLRRGQLIQAAQVIKLFNLEKTIEAQEVRFAELFTETSDKLRNSDLDTTTILRSSDPTKSMNLRDIANVAAAGVATSNLSNITDDILDASVIPPITSPNNYTLLPQHFKDIFNDDNVTSMVVFDLMISAGKSWTMCANLLENAKSRLPYKLEMIDSTSNNIDEKMPGYISYMKQFDSFVNFALTIDNSEMTTPEQNLMKQIIGCGHDSDANHIYPLNTADCKGYISAVSAIARAVNKAEIAMNDFVNKPGNTMSASSMSSAYTMSSAFTSSAASPPSATPLSSAASLPSAMTMTQQNERPVNHHTIRQLIAHFEKHVPPGGLVQFFDRSPISDETKNRNYLLSVYDHVRELAHVVAESEGSNLESKPAPANYFSILKHGPISIIGRLMFVKKMLPSRLEKVAGKLSVNLMHIIVHSCSPTVPSKPLPSPHITIFPIHNGRVVLNGGEGKVREVRSPQVCVQAILTHVINILKEISEKNNATGVFTNKCCDQLACSPTFDDITTATQELQHVNWGDITTQEESICVYSNLVTLLTVHMWLYKAWLKYQMADTPTLQNQFPDYLDDIVSQNSVAYRIGQLGVISLCELRAHFCDLHTSSTANALDLHDPWTQYIPDHDPKLIYVIPQGHLTSPPLQVLSGEMLHSHLHTAMESYITATVSINIPNKTVTIPELLLTHYHRSYEMCSAIFTTKDEALVNFLATLVTGDIEVKLVRLLRVSEACQDVSSYPIKVIIKPTNKQFTFTFNYETLKRDSHTVTTNHRRSNSLPPFLQSMERSFLDPDSDPIQIYNLTPVTLEYIKDRSSLVATLVSLVCPDEIDDIEACFKDDHFRDVRQLKRSISEISLVDMRSYRYTKLTNEYPTLKRHLVSFVVPLAAIEDPDILTCDDPILKLMTSDNNDKVKPCMINRQGGIEFMTCIVNLITEMTLKENWLGVVSILRSVSEVIMQEHANFRIIHDYYLTKGMRVMLTKGPTDVVPDVDFTKVPQLFLNYYDKGQQSRMIMQHASCLPIEMAVDIAQTCYNDSAVGPSMKVALRTKLEDLRVYQDVMSKMREMKQKLTSETETLSVVSDQSRTQIKLNQLSALSDWFTLQHATPTLVRSLLLNGDMFETARDWTKLKSLDDGKETDRVYVIHALRQDPPHTLQAFSVLEKYLRNDVHSCLHLCESLLDTITNFSDVVFITNFILEYLPDQLTNERRDELRLLHIGGVFLESIPEVLHAAYSQLVSAPKLILEQLIMNNKVELAGKLYKKMKSDLDLITDVKHQLTSAQFADLVSWYAGKALEFAVIQSVRKESEVSTTHELLTTLSSLQRFDSAKSKATRRNLDERRLSQGTSLSPTTSPMKHQQPFTMPPTPPPTYYIPSPTERRMSQGTSLSPTTSPMKHQQPFIMPPEPPSKQHWVPDSEVTVCMVCRRERFSMFSRRHHCRRCGRVVCAQCSNKTMTIKGISARTCDDCISQMLQPRRKTAQLNRTSEPLQESHSPSRHTTRSLSIVSTSEDTSSQLYRLIRHTDHEWKLNLSEQYNVIMREDFYYEQAPSAPLCISLTALLGDAQRAGHLMLKFCDDLSHMLRPIAPGVPNPEVDYTLVISMMKHILLHAKLNFIESGETDEEGLTNEDEGLAKASDELEKNNNGVVTNEGLGNNSDGLIAKQEGLLKDNELVKDRESLKLMNRENTENSGLMKDGLKKDNKGRMTNERLGKDIGLKKDNEGLMTNQERLGKDEEGLRMCDVYLARIDLLYLLISSNVPDIPSLNELASLDVARRLRDRLIENERLPLAIDVSTKCGLDPSGVWCRWGMSCLEMGQYAVARDKFSRCLKAPVDRNQNIPPPKMLKDITDYLENCASDSNSDIEMLLCASTTIKRLVSLPPPKYTEETSLSSPTIVECLYYLKTYGTHGDVVDFYQRHGYLMKAAQFILDHRCTSETFIEHLLIPCLTRGHLASLQDQMVMIDMSLERWTQYLTAACRYFMKAKLIHVLYQFQLFMKDFIRAAMTCITYFYQGGARSYLDLSERTLHLINAGTHFETFLDPRQWGTVRQPSIPPRAKSSSAPEWKREQTSSAPAIRLIQSAEEVNRNIAGVKLQLHITDYMYRSLSPSHSDDAPTSATSPPPTLFGNSRMRADLVHLIMMKGEKVSSSFEICLHISQQYRLSLVPILANVAHEMAKQLAYTKIDELVTCLEKSTVGSDETVDTIIGSCIIVLADDPSQNKQLDSLIKYLRSNSNKLSSAAITARIRCHGNLTRVANTAWTISHSSRRALPKLLLVHALTLYRRCIRRMINAMILCGKLRSAYLLAVNLDRVDDVRRIAGAAQRTGQTALKTICDKYLSQKSGS